MAQPEMSEHARRSSGIYGNDTGFVELHSANTSQASLAARGASPAGFVADNSTAAPAPTEAEAPNRGATAPAEAAATGATTTTTPPRRPWYKQRKWIIVQIVVACLAIVILFVLLFPVVRAIAQLVVNRSVINIDSAAISQSQNNSFQLQLLGVVTHTGIFNAKITFTEPIMVAWVRSNSNNVTHLGQMNFEPLNAHSSNKRATINQTTTFMIDDEAAFGEFSGALITQQNFTWRLTSGNLRVNALKFPVAKGLKFSKDTTLNGINNFNNSTKLLQFLLPSDDPAGGISFQATTSLNNSSPFKLDLGTTVFNLTYNDLFIGQGTSNKTWIAPGNNIIVLGGRLVPQNDSKALEKMGELFTRYLNNETSLVLAQGVSTQQADGSEISWLSAGLTALKLQVPFQAPGPINPIHSIGIDTLNLSFSEETAWSPSATSNTVHAQLMLPFGFSLSIAEIANSFAIMQNGSVVANLSTPTSASTSSIQVMSSNDTQGNINITISERPLQVPSDAHNLFSSFNTELTDADTASFQLMGHSSAVANLSIGQITLDPIKFDVTSSLDGLRGLQDSIIIEGVDVMGGTTNHINLNINVSIFNPSSLNLNTGDLVLQLTRDGAALGTTLLSNLTLNQGNNNLSATSAFEPNMNPQGLQTLNDFVGKKDVLLGIEGFGGSTNVASLLAAFESLHINAMLPALKTNLLNTTALKILPTTGRGSNTAHVTVNLVNPFTGGLTITNVNSTVMSHGLHLGTINTATNFAAEGHKTSTSPTLDLDMNLDPPTLFTLVRQLAVQSGEGTEQLDEIVALGGYQYVLSTNADGTRLPTKRRRHEKRANIFTGFNLPSFVDKAFKQLQADIVLSSAVSIGDYPTTLDYTQSAVPVATDESLNLLLPVLAQPIVQRIITGSILRIDSVFISNPQENSFETRLAGSITNAGPFDASIEFGEGLTISWSGQPLGKIAIPKIQVTGDVGAQLNLSATFQVADVGHLTSFTKTLLTEEDFEWDISGENLSISALGIVVPGVTLTTKSVKLKGMNGLKNGVVVNSFDLPSNDPAGGVHLTLQTTVTNPSQVGVQLSSIGFNNFVNSTFLGPATSTGGFMLAPQSTFKLPLVGRLVHQDSDSGLATVSQVFTDFIHGKSTDVTVVGDSAGPSGVSWLNDAIKSLRVSTVLPDQGSLQVIKSISLEQLELDFTPDTAYDPATSSNAVTAAFRIPFAFPIDIVALEQTIVASSGGQSFAQLAIPKGPASTDVESRIIHLTFKDVPFSVFGDKHPEFQQFLAQTTVSASETFQLSGSANTDASTAIGTLSLTDISFNVPTTIAGLQGLNTRPAVVSDLDVNHGFPDFLLIKVTTTLTNPSNLTIATGDVFLTLTFEGQNIGQADISNLKIVPGQSNYATDVHFQPQGDAQAAGTTLLENFLQGVMSNTVIVGAADTTNVDSLVLALEEIKLNANIPALHQNLITSTSIEFPIDIVQTGIASASVALSNPFTASINLLVVTATAVFQDITLGTVDHVDRTSDPIHADGHTNITSPALPLKFNLDPATIIKLLTVRSQQKGVSLGPLTELFQIVLSNLDFHPLITTNADTDSPACVSGQQFDVNDAILNSLAGLEVTLSVDSVVKLDDYQTELAFKQFNVPAVTDRSALFLIGAVAPPIVQTLVNQASLSFDVANITDISNEGFDLSLHGQLTGTGPLDAQITFVEPVTVTWQDQNIATITLPPVCAIANKGVPNYQTQGHLTITDLEAFTNFAIFLLHNPSFEWTISTNKLRLTALGTIFDDVSLSKSVSFKAFNGLPGVTISNFKLPGDDPASGITISTDSMIPSPAQLGIQLGTVSFNSFFNGALVGPLSGANLFLAASSITMEHLTGHITPKSGNDLDIMGVLFSNFLAGKNQTLQVQGDTVDPSGQGQTVSWLSAAFKTLTLEVTLPGQIFKIIDSITIEDLELELNQQNEDFNPLTSSKTTLATFQNPFGFSLQVTQASEDLTIAFNGADAAELKVPKTATTSGISTGNVADLMITFQKQTLHSLNNEVFASFFAQVTDKQSADVTLKGTADVTGRTAIGDVPISGIPFNVQSTIKGINDFGGAATLDNVTIIGSGGNGGNQFIQAPLTTVLQNPSNISLVTNTIDLPVFFKDVQLGRAAIDNFNLIPGENHVPSEFHYFPNNPNDTTAQSFLATYLTATDDIPLTIKGDSASSPFGSLQPALEGVTLTTSLKGLGATLISHINVLITLDSLVTNLVSVNFDVVNPLDTDFVIDFVQSDGSVNGTIFAHFDQSFDNFIVPAKSTANSGTFGNVLLVQGAVASLDIIPLGVLDIAAAQTARAGEGGYTVPWLQILQKNVPTTYTLDLGLVDLPLPSLKKAVQSIISSMKPSDAPTTMTNSSHAASITGSSSLHAVSTTGSGSSQVSETSEGSPDAPISLPSAKAQSVVQSPVPTTSAVSPAAAEAKNVLPASSAAPTSSSASASSATPSSSLR